MQNDKAKYSIVLSVKMEHLLKVMYRKWNILSSDMEQHQEQQEQQVQWRRDKVQELCSKGYSQREISHMLQVGLATVNRDISCLRNQAKTNIKKYIDERLPEEYKKCLVGLTSILKEAWTTSQNTEDKREKYKLYHWLKSAVR
jgi:Trp operon repressor